MRTVYGKLTALIFVTVLALMLFLPMRSGLEDHLYAYPHNLKMARGDSFDITCVLDADHAQAIAYSSVDESVAVVSDDGRVTAVNPGTTDIRLAASEGAKTIVHVEVVGTPTTVVALNTDAVYMEKGEVTGLSAVFNEGADDTRLEWLSEDPEIARIDVNGRVTALRGGETTVCALTPGGLRADARVFVHVSGDAMRIVPEALTVGTGAAIQMGATYFPDDTTDTIVRWVSSDPSLMQMDDDGTLHALGVGKPVLTAFSSEGLTDSAVVNIEHSADSFDLSLSGATIERGVELDLEPQFRDAEGNLDTSVQGHYIEWTSDNPSVAPVDGHGHVKGLSSGIATITAKADGMTAECKLKVTVFVRKIVFNETEAILLREDTAKPIQLTAEITPSDPDDPTITWTTDNDLVANVDENGLVTLTGGYGTATITARAASGAEARFTVQVVVKLPEKEEEVSP